MNIYRIGATVCVFFFFFLVLVWFRVFVVKRGDATRRGNGGLLRLVRWQPCADLHGGALGNLHNRFGISFSVLQWPSPPIRQRRALVFPHHVSAPHPPLALLPPPPPTLAPISPNLPLSLNGGCEDGRQKKGNRREKKTGQTFPISSLPLLLLCRYQRLARKAKWIHERSGG